MELNIVKYIREHGLEKTLLDFKLKSKDYGYKVVIKYDMIESDLSQIEVQEARGLVLEKNTWKIMSMGFMKFFNAAEGNAAVIDWNTAHVLEKLDGSLITMYWDWVIEEWCVATTGTAEAEGEVNNKLGTTFADLFWGVAPDNITEKVKRGYTYMFELCTPYNIVVKPNGESSITLLGIRRLYEDGSTIELPYTLIHAHADEIGIDTVKAFDLNEGAVQVLK